VVLQLCSETKAVFVVENKASRRRHLQTLIVPFFCILFLYPSEKYTLFSFLVFIVAMARTRARSSTVDHPPSVVDVSSSDDGGEKPPSFPVKRTNIVYSGRRKRSARKSKFPMVFSDSDSDEEISKAVYKDLRHEWKRLKKENRAMEAFASMHRLEVEKSLPVALLRSEVQHLKELVVRANKAKEEVEAELVETQ
jgi:hypothetical protein